MSIALTFEAMEDIGDSAILVAGPATYVDRVDMGGPYKELQPTQFEEKTLAFYKDILWDYHRDLNEQQKYEEGEPIRMWVKMYRFRTGLIHSLEFNYYPGGSSPTPFNPDGFPPGASIVALPPGDPPYDLPIWAALAGFFETGLSGKVAYERPDIGPNNFSQWEWFGPDGVDHDMKNAYDAWKVRTKVQHPDPVVVAKREAEIVSVIVPNFRSLVDLHVVASDVKVPPQGTNATHGHGPPDDGNGADGDWYVDDDPDPKLIYGPKKDGHWPAGEPYGGDGKYHSKRAQIISGLRYVQPLFLFNDLDIFGVWSPVQAVVNPPPGPQPEIRVDDYRLSGIPDNILVSLSAMPTFAMAIYIRDDLHFPIGGVPKFDNNGVQLDNPIVKSVSDPPATTGSWAYPFTPGEPNDGYELVESLDKTWIDGAGTEFTATMKWRNTQYAYKFVNAGNEASALFNP